MVRPTKSLKIWCYLNSCSRKRSLVIADKRPSKIVVQLEWLYCYQYVRKVPLPLLHADSIIHHIHFRQMYTQIQIQRQV